MNQDYEEEDYEEEDYEEEDYEEEDYEEEDDCEDYSEFADPGGHSALRAITPSNPRNLPCPTCKQPNRLTPKDRDLGYCCDPCADRAEGRFPYDY
jgi:hypothetical protein